MTNTLTFSMVCFPYVMMGLGQAIIAGTTLNERKGVNTDERRGRKSMHRAFQHTASTAGQRIVSEYPVLAPN